MKSIVLITAWRRPEFLATCLNHIQQAEGWQDNLYLFAIDNGGGGPFDPKVKEVIEEFPGMKQVRIHTHHYHGNSTNTLKGYHEAWKIAMREGVELIHLIESDIFIHPDYFNFHEDAHKNQPDCFYVSACRNQNIPNAGEFTGDFDDIYAHPSYQSLGVSFTVDQLTHIIKHDSDAFYRNMPHYLNQRFPKSKKKGFHTEQDGLIYRILEEQHKKGIFPVIPRAYHAGFTGYNRPASALHKRDNKWNKAGWRERAEMLMEMTQDEMNKRAGRAEYRDITKFPLPGGRTGQLQFKGNANSISTGQPGT